METVALLPWIFLTLTTSLVPAFFAKKFSPWWQRHGDIGEAIGTSLIAATALFTVVVPILKTQESHTISIALLLVGVFLAFMAHVLFEDNGNEGRYKSWFVAIAFALHNFPEGIASAQALIEHGQNFLTISILSHNIFDAVVMTLGLMSAGVKTNKLVYFLLVAAGGEVMGMLLAGSGFSQLLWISLLSVGALIGLALDSISHWSRLQTLSGLLTFSIIAMGMINFQ